MKRIVLSASIGTAAAPALAGLLWATVDGLAAVHDRAASTIDDLVGLGALAGAWVAVLWFAAGFGSAVLAALPDRRSHRWHRVSMRIAPAAIRRLARIVVGATVVTCGVAGSYGPALAHTVPPALPDLDRPTTTAGPADADLDRPDGVVVAPGDTLWGITADRLGPNPTNAEIAAEWPRWYSENRAVIGADPNLIFPGQHLQPPPAPAN